MTSLSRLERSLLLASAVSVVAFVVSTWFDREPWWPENPMSHPFIATTAASIAFWLSYPGRSLVKLWVFVPIAFAVIAMLASIVALVMSMPL